MLAEPARYGCQADHSKPARMRDRKRGQLSGATGCVSTQPESKIFEELTEQLECLKASVRARAEHRFRMNQAPVWTCGGTLPGSGQEHGAAAHAVRTVESVDGCRASMASQAMSTLANGQRAGKQARDGFDPAAKHAASASQLDLSS